MGKDHAASDSSSSDSASSSSSETPDQVEMDAPKRPKHLRAEVNPSSHPVTVKSGKKRDPPRAATMSKEDAHQSAYEHEEESSDTGLGSMCNKCCLFSGGVGVLVCCLPFACCQTDTPFRKKVEQGNVAAKLRYGKFGGLVGPGVYYQHPMVEEYRTVTVKVQNADVPKQSCLTKDNVTLDVNAVIYFKVDDGNRALFSVGNWYSATTNFAQTALRTIIGEHSLDSLFANRAAINRRLTNLIDKETDAWGVKVSHVEIKDITLPKDMQRVLASVAEATREGQAKVITAEAELRASSTLAEAADVMATNPTTLQLRYFQTLTEISADKNSTIIVPDSVTSLLHSVTGRDSSGFGGAGAGGEAVDASTAYRAMIDLRKEIEHDRAERIKRAEHAQPGSTHNFKTYAEGNAGAPQK